MTSLGSLSVANLVLQAVQLGSFVESCKRMTLATFNYSLATRVESLTIIFGSSTTYS